MGGVDAPKTIAGMGSVWLPKGFVFGTRWFAVVFKIDFRGVRIGDAVLEVRKSFFLFAVCDSDGTHDMNRTGPPSPVSVIGRAAGRKDQFPIARSDR